MSFYHPILPGTEWNAQVHNSIGKHRYWSTDCSNGQFFLDIHGQVRHPVSVMRPPQAMMRNEAIVFSSRIRIFSRSVLGRPTDKWWLHGAEYALCYWQDSAVWLSICCHLLVLAVGGKLSPQFCLYMFFLFLCFCRTENSCWRWWRWTGA
jgi:hypothetical protein